jgi:hypothetical protein
MSNAAIGDQREFRRPPAGRFSRCVPSMAIRICIVSVALFAGIFPVAARSLQIQSFHPLFPTRPSTAHAPSVGAPAATKLPREIARRKGKLALEERKRIAAAMNRRTASRKSPQTQKSVR